MLRLLQLPPAIQRYVKDGIAAHGARPRAARNARPRVPGAARPAAPSPRTCRCARSRKRSGPATDAPPTRATRAARRRSSGRPGLLELEELLGDYLETRVQITMGPRHGKVEIDFATLEDLERIYRVMTEGSRTAVDD